MLRCSDGSIYSGYTTDPHRREKVHNIGKGAKYTRTRLPIKLVYFEKFDNKSFLIEIYNDGIFSLRNISIDEIKQIIWKR